MPGARHANQNLLPREPGLQEVGTQHPWLPRGTLQFLYRGPADTATPGDPQGSLREGRRFIQGHPGGASSKESACQCRRQKR